jgi:hypothetical protein
VLVNKLSAEHSFRRYWLRSISIDKSAVIVVFADPLYDIRVIHAMLFEEGNQCDTSIFKELHRGIDREFCESC